MQMVRLIYASEVSEECGLEGVHDILQVSRERNEANEITGILCYESVYFVQWLEGARDRVNALYREILDDKRHSKVTILEYKEIKRREFDAWSMAYVSADNMDRKTIFKYSADSGFNPYLMTPESVRLFLIDLARDQEDLLNRTVDWSRR